MIQKGIRLGLGGHGLCLTLQGLGIGALGREKKRVRVIAMNWGFRHR